MTELYTISHCGKTWIVGIDGKDITKAKTSGGKSEALGGVPFMAISFDEIQNAPSLQPNMPCKECGKLVAVDSTS